MSNKKRVYISEDMKWVAIKKHILEDATIEELAQELGITTGPLNTYLRKNNIAPNSKCMKAGEKHKWCSSCRLFHKKVQFNKGKGYCKEVESSMKAEYYIKHKRNLDYASKQLALSDKGKLQNLKAQLKKHKELCERFDVAITFRDGYRIVRPEQAESIGAYYGRIYFCILPDGSAHS